MKKISKYQKCNVIKKRWGGAFFCRQFSYVRLVQRSVIIDNILHICYNHSIKSILRGWRVWVKSKKERLHFPSFYWFCFCGRRCFWRLAPNHAIIRLSWIRWCLRPVRRMAVPRERIAGFVARFWWHRRLFPLRDILRVRRRPARRRRNARFAKLSWIPRRDTLPERKRLVQQYKHAQFVIWCWTPDSRTFPTRRRIAWPIKNAWLAMWFWSPQVIRSNG